MLGLPAGTRLALSRALEPRVKCESTREDGSWMLGWALLEESTVLRFVLSAGRLGRASWSVGEWWEGGAPQTCFSDLPGLRDTLERWLGK